MEVPGGGEDSRGEKKSSGRRVLPKQEKAYSSQEEGGRRVQTSTGGDQQETGGDGLCMNGLCFSSVIKPVQECSFMNLQTAGRCYFTRDGYTMIQLAIYLCDLCKYYTLSDFILPRNKINTHETTLVDGNYSCSPTVPD